MTHAAQPPRPDAPRSRTSLYVGLGAAALAIASAITAIVMLTSSGPSGGLASREEVVRKSFAALAAGDADALGKLMMSMETRLGLMECKGAMPPVSQKKLDRQRAALEAAVAAAKGAKFEVVEIGKDDAPKVEKKGQPAGDDCTSKFDISQHTFDVIVKVTQGDGKPVEQKMPFQLWEVDGTWYLPQPPAAALAEPALDDDEHIKRKFAEAKAAALAEAGLDDDKRIKRKPDEGKAAASCEAVGRAYDALRPELIAMMKQLGVQAAEAAFAEDRAETIEFCREDGWPDDVIECTAKASSVMAAGTCMNKLPAAQLKKYEAAAKKLVRKFSRAGGTPDPAALGPHCTGYKTAVERLGACSKVPAHELDVHQRRMEATLKYGAVSNPYIDAEQRHKRHERWERACEIQVVAVTDLGKKSCGW